jgi:hypothetical protein
LEGVGMSLTTVTTKEISDNIIAQLEAFLNQTIPPLPKSFMRVLAKALAAVFVLLFKYGGCMFLQFFVQTATDKDTEVLGEIINPLRFWGRLFGVGDPVAATNAELLIDITVMLEVGSLPSGSQLVGAINGVTYINRFDPVKRADSPGNGPRRIRSSRRRRGGCNRQPNRQRHPVIR